MIPQVRVWALGKLSSLCACTLKGRLLHLLAEIKNSTALLLVFCETTSDRHSEWKVCFSSNAAFAQVKLWLIIDYIWISGGSAKMIHIH